MKIGTIIKSVAILAVALIVGIAIYLTSLDFNDYKPEIIAEVKTYTGRDLVIDGDLNLELSLTPSIAVGGVKFANAAWGSRPHMATVDRFEARVALLPLISGTIEVQKIVLRGVDILIETDSQGRANYDFESAKSTKSAPEKPVADEGGGGVTLPIVRHVSIEDATLTYKDGVSGQQHVVVIGSLSVHGAGANDPMEAALTGSYNDNPIQMTATLGAPAAFLHPAQPWPVALSLKAGGAEIAVKGTIGEPATGKNMNLTLAASGQQLGDLSKLAGAPVPPLGAYKVAATVTGDPGGAVSLSNFLVKIGSSDLGGTLTATLGGKRPRITAVLTSERLDLADFVQPAPPEKADAAGRPAPESSKSSKSDRVFPDDPLPLEALKAVDADVGVSIAKLVAGVEIDDVQIKLDLRNGDLNISTLKAIVADGAVDGGVRLNAATAPPSLNAKLTVKGFDVGKLLKELAVTDLLEGALNIKVDVRGQGASIAGLMAGLNGQTSIVMGAGRMKSDALDTFIGGPTKFLTELVTGERKEYTVINCTVSRIDIKNGLATNKALLFDTDFATISGKGTINLATEALDMMIDPQPKSATINTAVPITIGGTLANPSYGVDKLAAAQKVGGLLGGFVFPPAVLLGLGELGTGDDNPCLKQASGKAKATPAQTPAPTPKAAPSITENPTAAATDALEKAAKGVGGVLKGLFSK